MVDCTRQFSVTSDVPGISLGTDTSVVSETLLVPGSSAGTVEPACTIWSPLPLDTSLCWLYFFENVVFLNFQFNTNHLNSAFKIVSEPLKGNTSYPISCSMSIDKRSLGIE